MPLTSSVYLEIDVDGDTAVFHFREDLTDRGEVNIQHLLSQRGQYLREAFDVGSELLPEDVVEDTDLEDRRGYHVDGGIGDYRETLTFKAAKGDQWGTGASNPDDEFDTTKHDATGSHLLAMKQVFEYTVAQARADSSSPARLHIGEWTDGSHGSTAGVFDQPLPVAINETAVTKDGDDPSAIEVELEITWTAMFPDVDLLGTVEDGLNEIADSVPDF